MYQQNEVFEAIEVFVHCSSDKINILKFKWRNRLYKVIKMENTWQFPDNEGMVTCYTVVSNKKYWELCYHHETFKWELNQYIDL